MKKIKAKAKYERQKAQAGKRQRDLSKEGREIGPLPEVIAPARRQAARMNFRKFCELYFPMIFTLPWSPDHKRIITRIVEAITTGGLFAMAMPRGNGKTSLVVVACLWAILYGHRRFVCLIGSTEAAATSLLEMIKKELETNDLLLEDFPETVHPIRCLDGITQRAKGQLLDGRRTQIHWLAKDLIFPSVKDSPASGAIVKVAGLTGNIRGMVYRQADGRNARPDLVIVDDPQTDESARSPSQCATREAVLAGAILGLAGPGQKIAGIMPCTVISPGDMADRILDPDICPDWQGIRTKLLYELPINEKLWADYAELRTDALRNGQDTSAATAFYKKHRLAMDKGAKPAWKDRHLPDEISAVQHAMNLLFRNEAAFWSEYQNEPQDAELSEIAPLADVEIAARINRIKHLVCPVDTDCITCHIDVHQELLYYCITAWARDFTGAVIDYGTYPKQTRKHFALAGATRTMGKAAPGTGFEGALYAGLEATAEAILAREYKSEGGQAIRIARCLIDANWGQSTDIVYQFCRRSQFANILTPAHGKYVGASTKPLNEYARKKGDAVGLQWRIPAEGKRGIRHLVFDANFWKSFLHHRLRVAIGDPGSLTLFGTDPGVHRLFSEHLTAEYPVRTEANGRQVDEWKWRANRPDNHWLDCAVGSAVAANIAGVKLQGEVAEPNRQTRPRKKKKKALFAE